MPTRITQIERHAGAPHKLKIEGTLTLADAELLEAICNELCGHGASAVSVDLTGVVFLDSDSASVLCRLKSHGILLEGLDLFAQTVVEIAEKTVCAD
jgi:anti-anti-sigma regulatory factor